MIEEINKVNQLLDSLKFTNREKEEFWNIIYPIFKHSEFQKRMNAFKYPHHGFISLGNHILDNTIVTYLISKRKIDNGEKINLKRAVKISLFHDLYEEHYSLNKKQLFSNSHAFVHPIEAIINAVIWYPEYFKNINDAKYIIDGVIHHMWPIPVKSIKNFKDLELLNIDKVNNINPNIKKEIIYSTNRFKLGKFSISKSLSKEGRIVSIADKIVATHEEIITIRNIITLMINQAI